MSTVTVMMTCIGGTFGLDTVASLRSDEELDVRVIGVDANKDVVNQHFVDVFHPVPMASTDPEGFVDAVLNISQRESVDILLPGADEEVFALSRVKSTFSDVGVQCVVEDHDKVMLMRDKLLLFERLLELSVPVPRFAPILQADDIFEVAPSLGYPERRIILKPRSGRGARGVIIVDSSMDSDRGFIDQGSYGTGNLNAVLEHLLLMEGKLSLMAMEYLSGPAFDVDCVARDGVALCVVPRRRLWKDPFSRMSQGCIVEPHQGIEELTKKTVEALSLNHVFDFDYGMNEEGVPGLFELNPRFSGSVAASLAAGINVPSFFIRSLMGLSLPSVKVKPGARMFPVTRMGFVDA